MKDTTTRDCTGRHIADFFDAVAAELETRESSACDTGFAELDALTGDIRPGQLRAITGAPGVGKSVSR